MKLVIWMGRPAVVVPVVAGGCMVPAGVGTTVCGVSGEGTMLMSRGSRREDDVHDKTDAQLSMLEVKVGANAKSTGSAWLSRSLGHV